MAAYGSLALGAYRFNALSAAQLRRLLGFETHMQLDDFLKEHEVYHFTVTDFKQIAKRSVRGSGKGAQHLSRPPCVAPGEA